MSGNDEFINEKELASQTPREKWESTQFTKKFFSDWYLEDPLLKDYRQGAFDVMVQSQERGIKWVLEQTLSSPKNVITEESTPAANQQAKSSAWVSAKPTKEKTPLRFLGLFREKAKQEPAVQVKEQQQSKNDKPTEPSQSGPKMGRPS